MKHLPLTFLCFSLLFRLALGLSPRYITCQLQKSTAESALEGCPKGTLYVSPTDSRANFSSVQEAVDSLPETGKAVILIGRGKYHEMINVTRAAPLVLLGQLDPATASIRSGNATQRNLVHIWNNLHAESGGLTDEETATLTVGPSWGHPFGSVDFKAYNIDFENLAANFSIAPALAVSITLANASFYGCSFASYQDTYFAGYGSNSYAMDTQISGQTDFLFGFGRLFLQTVTLALRGCGGGITAWQGSQETGNGVYISNSTIMRSPDAGPDVVTSQRCYLGRPWGEGSVAVFLKTHMDDSIHPHGFISWDGETAIPATTFYAEFQSHGPGGDLSARVAQDHILDLEQSKAYTLENVFQGIPKWIDTGYKIM